MGASGRFLRGVMWYLGAFFLGRGIRRGTRQGDHGAAGPLIWKPGEREEVPETMREDTPLSWETGLPGEPVLLQKPSVAPPSPSTQPRLDSGGPALEAVHTLSPAWRPTPSLTQQQPDLLADPRSLLHALPSQPLLLLAPSALGSHSPHAPGLHLTTTFLIFSG